MHQIFEAAVELGNSLDAGGFDYCFIGGLSVQRWGEARLTKDADATVLTNFVDDEKLVDYLLIHFQPRYPNAREFSLRHRVVLIQTQLSATRFGGPYPPLPSH